MTRKQRLNSRRFNTKGGQIIAYMYANVSGTRPVSKNGPAFLVLGSFSSVSELVGHINRVYGKGGPQCTILQTPTNTFVPLLAPKESMTQYPVQRATVHTKALISLYTSRRQREKKEFDSARQEQRPGIVDKSSRDVQMRMQRLQELGLDPIPEDAQGKNSEAQTASGGAEANAGADADAGDDAPVQETAPQDSTTPSPKSVGDAKQTEANDAQDATTTSQKTQAPTPAPKNVIAPLNASIKLANQNFAVVSIIHDERKGRLSPQESKDDKNATKYAPLEPIVSFLGTFNTQKDAEAYAKKANSSEVPGAPLFVVQMYSWLFTEAVSMESVPSAYPNQPMLEKLIGNHQKVQEQGETEYIRSLEEDNGGDESVPDAPGDAKTKAPDAKLPSPTEQRTDAPDEKVPPIRAAIVNDEQSPDMSDAKVELNMENVIRNDCVLDILKSRVLKRTDVSSSQTDGSQ